MDERHLVEMENLDPALDAPTVTHRLSLKFETSAGKEVSMSYNPAEPTVTASDVDSLMDTIVANKGIFVDEPSVKVSAAMVDTTTTPFAITNG